ncbi:hypothetical protein KY331_01360 [Candidatus Woesearchaeota archaeon]|nr:hypothetical protein [Candidatus Woesearchaeota archaeon]
MVNNNFKKYLLFITTLLILFVFITGILLGRTLTKLEVEKVSEFIKQNELNTESYLIEQELLSFEKNNCEFSKEKISDLSNELASIGRQIIAPGAKEKIGSENYHFLKIKFHLMQIRTYTLFKKLIDNCNISPKVIIYYYGANDPKSAEQGPILDKIVDVFDAKVFAIEFNYSQELQFLELYYNVTETPTTIINYNIINKGLADFDKIKNQLS